MLDIKISAVVAQIVRHELIHNAKENEALYMHFDLGMGVYTNSESYTCRRGLHLLYHVNPGGTYISVFSAVTDSPFASIKDINEWKHEGTHDSGWRDIRVFSDVYFKMAEEINNELEADGEKTVAPKDMHEHNNFGLFRDELFRWVPVEIAKVDSYEKTIRVL